MYLVLTTSLHSLTKRLYLKKKSIFCGDFSDEATAFCLLFKAYEKSCFGIINAIWSGWRKCTGRQHQCV